MDIADIKAFVAVVEAGSLSRAASELHLTQPAVTRRLQRLEQSIGATLVDRRRRPLALTEAGKEAVERCRRLISAADELRALTQGEAMPSREVRVGVAHALSELALSEPVDHLRAEFPAVVLRLHTGWSKDLLQRVRSGALDAAVLLLPKGENLPAGVGGEALGREHLAVIAGRSSRFAGRDLRSLEDAVWVLNPEGCAARASLQRALAREGVTLRVGVETYNYELQLSLIARGCGLGLVPSRLLERSPSRSALRTLRIKGLDFPLTIWMVTGELPAALGPPMAALARQLTGRLANGQRVASRSGRAATSGSGAHVRERQRLASGR